ncbi:MAG: nucleotidyltransferase domain-containing protein [Chitinophagales bacterium]|nr:nucleotidyltransferase domain-containing protein [Chitinophagales bacterium]
MRRDDILNYLRENKDFFQQEFQVSKLGIFGSFARDEMNENSDIDILIDFQDDTSDMFFNKEDIREIVKNKFKREVDICYPEYLNKYIKSFILKDAIYV